MNDDEVETSIQPLKSKRIGENFLDSCIAVTDPSYGNLQIIGIENNRKYGCQLVVCLH